MYQRLQGNFPHNVPKGQCHQEQQQVLRKSQALALPLLVSTHLASARVARATAQAVTNAAGNPVIRKGFRQSEKDSETIFLLRLRDFFLYSSHKNILLNGEREKQA